MTIRVRISYFAVLREERGLDVEEVVTEAGSCTDLYEMLKRRHGFSLPAELVGVAVNGQICRADAALREGDEVVFLPPVAGG